MTHATVTPLEIAIRHVKAGQEDAFVAARADFIGLLKMQAGVERDWEFQSFFTMPTPDERDVFVGMTRYDSLETIGRIGEKLMGSQQAQAFFSTFDMKAFVLVTPADGRPFRLEDVIQHARQVLEVAVRRPKAGSEDKFEALRTAFFGKVAEQPGYIMDREFVDLQSGTNVVLIAWESQAAFQNALGVLQTQPEMGAFFGAIDVQAYQAMTLAANG